VAVCRREWLRHLDPVFSSRRISLRRV
jgi:hypothetical protein